MDIFTIKNLTFTYAGSGVPVLKDLSFSVKEGEFVMLCGLNGSGKTTLLQLIVPAARPLGKIQGEVLYEGSPIEDLPYERQVTEIGYVGQDAELQFVTDTVWQEIAFGLENLGLTTGEIRRRVAEMVTFFGLEGEMGKRTEELSAGEKQAVNLAAVLAVRPKILLLDEPTSNLDPIAAERFLYLVQKINRELGTAILICEQNIDRVIPISNKVIVLEKGNLLFAGKAEETARYLLQEKKLLALALPLPTRLAFKLKQVDLPFTIQEGRRSFLICEGDISRKDEKREKKETQVNGKGNIAIQLSNVWFRYDKKGEDVLRDATLSLNEGEIYGILGANGVGKTTLLNVMAGVALPYSGKVQLLGKPIAKYTETELFGGLVGILPQNVKFMFAEDTLEKDLQAVATEEKKVIEISKNFGIGGLLQRNPLDLSGGELKRAALAKIMLKAPRMLFLDEPTSGLDVAAKRELGSILLRLKQEGHTIVLVSHDVEFAADITTKCTLLFNGEIMGEESTKEFFLSNMFYTTQTRRLTLGKWEGLVTAEEVLKLCGKSIEE